MATIRKTVDVNTSADIVWEKISDVANISKLIGFLADSKLDGDNRICELSEGGTLSERIISVDSELQRVAYTITESPLGMDFHVAIMELQPTDQGTRLTWTVDLKPDAAAAHMEPMLDAACEDFQTTLLA